MNSDEIRSAYLEFFERRAHKKIASSSLIPHGDPTLLLTNAGMVQIKPYFTGQKEPPALRLVSSQKCFRTTDIELVGDSSHLTFFEMLGNFSVGDYFKREAIAWAWEFLTQHLSIPADRLSVTVLLEDDEAYGIWIETGVPAERIFRFDEDENFWGPAGSSGPCGPDSEIHYDLGKDKGCGEPNCGPNCDCGRFLEFWNLVFTQFDQAEDGSRTLLPAPNIDTGMGLARLTTILQGKSSVYETDIFSPILERVAAISGKKYGNDDAIDHAMRVVTEHGRAVTFLIADGVIPGNEGRGYVLRRLLRRATLFGLRLGLDKPFLAEIAAAVTCLGHVYPEVVERQDFIKRVAELEETRFSETLKVGLEVLEGVLATDGGTRGKQISGKDAFRLYDTYGLPVELTAEVTAERGLSVDMAGFEKEMEAQRQRAKSAHKFDLSSGELDGLERRLGVKLTPFLGYDNIEMSSRVLDLIVDGQPVETIVDGQEATVILESTPFYGELGGQVGDTGQIVALSGRFEVTDTAHLTSDVIAQQGWVSQGSLSVGDEVVAAVTADRRLDIARNHTATHLLQAALRQVLGDEVQQRGSLVAPDRLRFDFSYLTAMMPEEIAKVQAIVNELIRRNLPVLVEEMPYPIAIDRGAIALFGEKYGDTVRVVSSGLPAVSVELCGGTHVAASGEIGLFRIISEASIGSGMRRIEAATGRGAEMLVTERFGRLDKIAGAVGGAPDEVTDKVAAVIAERDEVRRQALHLERELAQLIVERLVMEIEVVNGTNVLAARVPSFPQQVVREMVDQLRSRLKSGVIVLGAVQDDRLSFLASVTPDLVEQGYDAGKIAKQVAQVTGGGGGGKPGMAQAGGRDAGKLDEALRLVRSLV